MHNCCLCKGRHLQKKIYFRQALPVKSEPPPCLNGQGDPFSGRQRHYFNAYYRIKFKLILVMKMMISVIKIVIILMITVTEMTKKQTNTMAF